MGISYLPHITQKRKGSRSIYDILFSLQTRLALLHAEQGATGAYRWGRIISAQKGEEKEKKDSNINQFLPGIAMQFYAQTFRHFSELFTETFGQSRAFTSFNTTFSESSSQGLDCHCTNGASPPEGQKDTAERPYGRCSLWVLPSTPSVSSIFPLAHAHSFSFLRKPRNRFCLHGCVFDSRICHIY